MTVRATCSSCGAAFAAPPHLYGQQLPCPTCGGVVAVPNPGTTDLTAAPVDDLWQGGLPQQAYQQPQSYATPAPAMYRPAAADHGMSSSDVKVIVWACVGVAVVLLLLVAAIWATKHFSQDTPAVAAPTTNLPPTTTAPAATAGPETPAAGTGPAAVAPVSPPRPAVPDTPAVPPAAPVPVQPLSPQEEEQAIRKCFADYSAAMTSKNGTALAGLVTSSTVDYYEKLRQHALRSDEATVRGLPVVDLLTVLWCRQAIDVQTLQSLDGRGLLARSTEQALLRPQARGNIALGTITITGEAASADLLNNGRPGPMQFSFRKEQGQWKFDVVSLIKFVGDTLDPVLRMAGPEGKDQAVMQMLQQMDSRVPSPAVWQPLVKP